MNAAFYTSRITLSNPLNVICALIFLCNGGLYSQNDGSSCAAATQLYPASDCNNTCGSQYCGGYPCENGNCTNFDMPATAGVDGTCTTDDDSGQIGTWLKVEATTTSFTITNETDYAGPGASIIERKDYAVFSGSCGSLTQIDCQADVNNGTSFTVSGLTSGVMYYIYVTRSANSIAEGCIGCNMAATCITSTVPYVSDAGEDCTSAMSLSTNTTYSTSNANQTAGGVLCAGSTENDAWFQWCAPITWPMGQSAYINVNNQTCNSTSGLQLSVWNSHTVCPTSTADPDVVCQNPGNQVDYYYTWPTGPGRCHYITIDGYAGTACSFDITVGSIIVLPVELISFTGEHIDNKNRIEWSIASQSNNKQFTLYRSNDGISYDKLYEEQGQGTTTTQYNYSFDDYFFTKNAYNYYRLTQEDFNGHIQVFDLVVVDNRDRFDRNSKPIKSVDIMGRPVDQFHQGIRLDLYPDGSVRKVFVSSETR